MTAVTVVRDSAASFLICRSRSSGRLIVVRLMHQIIRVGHIDVNALAGAVSSWTPADRSAPPARGRRGLDDPPGIE